MEVKNYGPITLHPLISIVLEKSFHDQLHSYVTECKMIYKMQSAFKSDFSTDTCLSYFCNILKIFHKSECIILIDLQEVFDTIDHKILLQKIECIGPQVLLKP